MRLLTIAILGAAALLAACSDSDTDSAIDPSATTGAGGGAQASGFRLDPGGQGRAGLLGVCLADPGRGRE